MIFDDFEHELDRAVDYAALFRFRSGEHLDGYLQWRTWDTGERAPLRTLSCADGEPGRDVWEHGEYPCYVSDEGTALLRWTDERSDTYGVLNAVAGRTDLAALYRHWPEVSRVPE